MILYPAIDLKDGQCVRLLRGDMRAATVFGDDPAAQARAFAAAGCRWLHLVDLDGAFAGRPVNARRSRRSSRPFRCRSSSAAASATGRRSRPGSSRGVARVVLGTAAVRDPELVRDAARAHPGRVAVGIDARDGRVAVEGWAEATDIDAVDLARRFEDAGVAALDLHRHRPRRRAWPARTSPRPPRSPGRWRIPVIASGGIASLDDLRALKACGAPLDGAITGRALYDGRLDLAAALRLPREPDGRC